MAFASDAHRKWWFANHGSGSGGVSGMVSFPDFESAFSDMERQEGYASEQAAHGQARAGANVDGPAAGGRNPMPTMTPEESAAWRAGLGK